MQMVRRPQQLTLLSFLQLLSIPIFMLNVWVLQKGPITKVFAGEKLWWIGIQAAWALLTMRWFFKARFRALWSFCIMAAAVLCGNIYFLVHLKNYALAFYALFLVILSVLYFVSAYGSLKEAYFHSGRRWFEGHPRFLPRIEAELTASQQSVSARLSRLGFEGCYAYPGTDLGSVDAIRLKLGDLNLECAVELVGKSDDGLGYGLRFVAQSPDQMKDIRDFIDRVRSAGYVS